MSNQQKSKIEFFSKVEKMNSELLSFTYGSLIVRLIKDFEKIEEINEQLDKILVDDFLAKNSINPCQTFKDTIDVITKSAFKNYLGVNCDSLVYSDTEYGLIYNENPLNDYVELPDKYKDMWYSNLICGVIKGALETLNIQVECNYVKDILKGDDTNEIRVKLVKIIDEKFVDDDE